MPAVLYSARVVCPMIAPPIDDGGVLVARDRVAAVGPAAHLRRDAVREHRIDGVLLPGLVNASTQLEAVGGPDVPPQRAARRGIHQLLRAGVTCVGDIVRSGPAVPAAVRAGLTGTSWVEIDLVDVGGQDAVLAALERTLDLPAAGRTVGVAPSCAPCLGTGVLQALGSLAAHKDAPVHLRAAFDAAEARALTQGRGPFADDARRRGLEFEWLQDATGLTPVRYLDRCGVLTARTTLAGGALVDREEVELLADRRVAVVCMPASAMPPLIDYVAAGVRLAVGTGFPGTPSLGESADPPATPRLRGGSADVLRAATMYVRGAGAQGLATWAVRGEPVEIEEHAVRLITVEGARAMGWGDAAGVLAPGRRADLPGIELATTPAEVYAALVDGGAGRQILTVVGGVRRARRDGAGEPWPDIEED